MKLLRSLVPMAFVESVPRSVQFYRRLGFEVGHSHTPPGEIEPTWAWLASGGARLMVGSTLVARIWMRRTSTCGHTASR